MHWGNFNLTIVGRVRDALIKLKTRKKVFNKINLFEEMDMGKKERGKKKKVF